MSHYIMLLPLITFYNLQNLLQKRFDYQLICCFKLVKKLFTKDPATTKMTTIPFNKLP